MSTIVDTRALSVKNRCSLCRGIHHLEECLHFLNIATVQWEALIHTQCRCFACLNCSHWVADCNQKRCGTDGCPGVHSQLLHHTRVTEGGRKGQETGELGGDHCISRIKRTMVEQAHQQDITDAHKRPRTNPAKAILPHLNQFLAVQHGFPGWLKT